MDESTAMPTTDENLNLFAKFAELPSGVQRIIIAVVLLLIIAAAMFLQRMIRVEEEPDPEVIAFESAEAFADEVRQEQ